MGHSKHPPPKRSSRIPPAEDADKPIASKPPPTKSLAKMPARRQTMEVQIGWLDTEEKPSAAEPPPPSSKRGPPRLPGGRTAIPPMPVPTKSLMPAPRNTIEVEMQWVELVDNDKAEAEGATAEPRKKPEPTKKSDRPAKPASLRPKPLPAADATKPRPKIRPIRREED